MAASRCQLPVKAGCCCANGKCTELSDDSQRSLRPLRAMATRFGHGCRNRDSNMVTNEKSYRRIEGQKIKKRKRRGEREKRFIVVLWRGKRGKKTSFVLCLY